VKRSYKLDDHKNNHQNSHLRPSILAEGDRPNIAGWRLSGRDDEELIEGVSFPVYRRVSTMIFIPGQNASSVEMVAIDPQELQASQERDQSRGA
jgi:hypothetical protein